MKVKPEHLAIMRAAVEPLDTPEMRARYKAGDFPRSQSVKDLDTRYRFDLYAMAGSWRLFDHSDYIDSHIATALKAVVPPLEKE